MEKTPGIQELLNLVHTGNFDEFKKLMTAQNIDVNAADEAGDTILHHAAGKGKRDIVRYVIEKGANVNAKNNVGSTPLHKAAVGNQIWCVQFLLEHKAEPHVKNNAGILPEQLCNLDKVKKLFESGDVVTVHLDIPREIHKRVIGQKGAKIQEIRIASGAQVTVPGPNDKNSAIVIKGRPEAVAKAKAMINRIADMGLKIAEEGAFSGAAVNADPAAVRAAAAAENAVSVSVPVPKERHALLFQKKNQTALQRFIEEHGVQITVPAASSTDHVIVIRGAPEAVDLAVKRIFAMTSPASAPAAASRSSDGGSGKGAPASVISSMSQAREQLLKTNRDDSAGDGNRGGRGRGNGGAGANGMNGGEATIPSKTTVVVRNVSFDATEQSIKEAFTSAAGAIAKVRLPTHADSGKPRGIAFVEFVSEESLQKALALNNSEIAGRKVTVEVANDRASRTPTLPRSNASNGTASPTPARAASSSSSSVSTSSSDAVAASPKPKQSSAAKPKKTA